MIKTSIPGVAVTPSLTWLVSASPAHVTGESVAVPPGVSETWKLPFSGRKPPSWNVIVLSGLLWAMMPGSLRAQMNMDPYFTTINYPLEKNSLMLTALPDFQIALYGGTFVTGMLMAEYGITSQWTVGVMVEGRHLRFP